MTKCKYIIVLTKEFFTQINKTRDLTKPNCRMGTVMHGSIVYTTYTHNPRRKPNYTTIKLRCLKYEFHVLVARHRIFSQFPPAATRARVTTCCCVNTCLQSVAGCTTFTDCMETNCHRGWHTIAIRGADENGASSAVECNCDRVKYYRFSFASQ